MDEPIGQDNGGKNDTGNANVGRPGNPVGPQEERGVSDIERSNGIQHSDVVNQLPNNYWKRLLEEKPDRTLTSPDVRDHFFRRYSMDYLLPKQQIDHYPNWPTHYRCKYQCFCGRANRERFEEKCNSSRKLFY